MEDEYFLPDSTERMQVLAEVRKRKEGRTVLEGGHQRREADVGKMGSWQQLKWVELVE